MKHCSPVSHLKSGVNGRIWSTFWENSGGGLTTQPVGTATMTAVTRANRVDLESFSSRCWTFRRTRTSADPIRVLCTRLALPLTLSLLSRLAPRARLTVGVPTRALWLPGIFLRRKKIRLVFQPGPYGCRGFSYVERKDVRVLWSGHAPIGC